MRRNQLYETLKDGHSRKQYESSTVRACPLWSKPRKKSIGKAVGKEKEPADCRVRPMWPMVSLQ